jgi:hypothetical protein
MCMYKKDKQFVYKLYNVYMLLQAIIVTFCQKHLTRSIGFTITRRLCQPQYDINNPCWETFNFDIYAASIILDILVPDRYQSGKLPHNPIAWPPNVQISISSFFFRTRYLVQGPTNLRC